MWKTRLWIRHDWWTYELTEAVVIYTRSAQDQVSSIEYGEIPKAPLLTEGLLAVIGWLGDWVIFL